MPIGITHAREIRPFDPGGLFIPRFRDPRRTLREEKIGIAARRSTAEFAARAAATLAAFGARPLFAHQTMTGVIAPVGENGFLTAPSLTSTTISFPSVAGYRAVSSMFTRICRFS
ncbi:MAG: hypothetical protein GY859_08795 [Desulfobacterales bacterium]|nr:hypothetical protein [Desulfobacterales bacterium]